MPGIHVVFKHVKDERDFGEKTNNETDSEDYSDQNREDQELPEAVWGLIRGWV